MAHYTLQVSNHPKAMEPLPMLAATESWQTVYDGHIATAKEARQAVDTLAKKYLHVRAFKGLHLGKLWHTSTRG